jgi:aspartate aminotransferase-like enzyme
METKEESTPASTALSEKMSALMALRAEMEVSENGLDALKKQYSQLESDLKKILSDLGLKTVKDAEGRSITLTTPMLVASFSEGQKERGLQWLKDNGLSHFVKEQVHYADLNRVIKERLEAGESYPEEFIKIDFIQKLQVRRS